MPSGFSVSKTIFEYSSICTSFISPKERVVTIEDAAELQLKQPHLARLETRILFEELLPRLRSIELTGPVVRMRSNFVNGIKHMPVRVRLA